MKVLVSRNRRFWDVIGKTDVFVPDKDFCRVITEDEFRDKLSKKLAKNELIIENIGEEVGGVYKQKTLHKLEDIYEDNTEKLGFYATV